MDAIDIDVDVSHEATHDVVTFTIENYRTSAVRVRLVQPLPDDVSTSQVAPLASHEGDSWELSGDELEFDHVIDWGLVVETAYALKDVDVPTLEGMMAETVVEVRGRDGTEIETGKGLELSARDGPDRSAEREDASADAPGTERDDAELAPGVDRSHGEASTGGERDGAGEGPETEANDGQEPDPGPGTVGSRPTGGRSADAGPFTGGWSRAGDEASDGETPDDEPVDADGAETAHLPDVPASYILADLPDEVGSEDFFWTAIERDDSTAGRDGESQPPPQRVDPTPGSEDRSEPDTRGDDRDETDPGNRGADETDEREAPGGSGGLFSRVRSWFG